jgi:hypothetical protein
MAETWNYKYLISTDIIFINGGLNRRLVLRPGPNVGGDKGPSRGGRVKVFL